MTFKEKIRQGLLTFGNGETGWKFGIRNWNWSNVEVPHLDGQYTVFGEVVEGLDIVDRIQQVETFNGDRPKADVVVVKATVLDK